MVRKVSKFLQWVKTASCNTNEEKTAMSLFRTINPNTGESIKEYHHWNASQISSSLSKSEAAHHIWQRCPISERLKFLNELKKVVEDQKIDLASLATIEMGKTVFEATAEIDKCIKLLSHYEEHALELLKNKPIGTEHQKSFISYQPLGTILLIMPWNFPYWQVLRAAIPALITGNAVLLKHADNISGVSFRIEALMKAAGLPSFLFQSMLIDHEQIVDVINSSAVSAVSLTGSEQAGRSVASTAGKALKKCVLELGGSDPYIVFPDADVKNAAEICMKSRLINNGQSCIAAKRFIIHQSIFENFREECIAIARQKAIGDPSSKDTHIGPLAKESILTETKRQVEESIVRGARIIFKSDNVPQRGFFHPIVILTDVQKGQPAFDDEIFAPVASLIKFNTTEEAVALANDHRYGLGAALFSANTALATDIGTNRINAGFVAINSMVISDPRLPFGGIKDSGYGRELSIEGLMEFVNIKTVVVNS